MLKIITTLMLCFVFVQAGFTQAGLAKTDKPDFDKIGKAIKDPGSPFFYTKLIKRCNDNDTTLTIEEYRYLYYGYSFQDNYSPYGKASVNDELKKAIEENETDKIIELEKKVLQEFPFNLRNINMLSYLLEKKGALAEADLYDKKMIRIAKAILSTGDGSTDSTAMFVISVEHEYDLISLLGYKFGGVQSLAHNNGEMMDRMKLEKNDENLDYLYFNVDRLFSSMEKTLKKKN